MEMVREIFVKNDYECRLVFILKYEFLCFFVFFIEFFK